MPTTNKSSQVNVRRLAYELIARCEHDRTYSNLVLDAAIRRHALSDADRALLTALVYGVLETRLTLDYLLTQLSDRPLETLDGQALLLLRMGLYQLRCMDRIPPHAALNETVALAPRHMRGFINAVLRRYTREGDIPFPDPALEPIRYLSVRYSFAEARTERFVSLFGFERTEAIFKGANQAPPLTLRVNTQKTTREALAAKLTEAGHTVLPSLHAPHALRLPGGNPTSLPGFAEGEFFVQDEASQLCVEAVGIPSPTPDDLLVLDTCACPGSKSFGMLIEMGGKGHLMAFDLHENKLSLIQKGAARLGLSNLTTASRDARMTDESLLGKADRVLCDVPCSGFGVLAKKTEIRYKDLDALAPLPDIQLAILENACRYVRPGGSLVYSTCTVFPEENEGNVARFLARHSEFSPTDFTVGDLCSKNGMLLLTPDLHGTDGFFMAKFTKE